MATPKRTPTRRRPPATLPHDWSEQSWAKVGVLIGGIIAAAAAGGWQVGGAVSGGAEALARRMDAIVGRLDVIERRLSELEKAKAP